MTDTVKTYTLSVQPVTKYSDEMSTVDRWTLAGRIGQ